MRCSADKLRLCVVVSLAPNNGMPLIAAVEAALLGGATMVQFREKDASDDDIVRTAAELTELCRSYGAPLIVNDRPDLAVRAGADGVHVGQTDAPAEEARRVVGPDAIVGVSASTVQEMEVAAAGGADYIGAGAIYSTMTKEDADVIAISDLTELARVSKVPVMAIGGLTKDTVGILKGTGISGIAAASAVFSARDPELACRELIQAIDKIL